MRTSRILAIALGIRAAANTAESAPARRRARDELAHWRWATRGSALFLAVAVLVGYLAPPGILRAVAYGGIALFIVLFIECRRRAYPNEEFKDTPWSM